MCPADTDPYNKWLNLYNKDVESIWYSEHPQLRNAAMLLKALDHEFKRIYDSTKEKIKSWENKFILEKDKSLHDKDLTPEKENIACNILEGESPDVFICTPSSTQLNLSINSDNEIITSQESSCSHNVSPKINRLRKLPKFKKLKRNNDSNYSSLEVNQTPKISNKLQILKNVVDMTVIQTTPEISIPVRSLKSHRYLGKIKKGNSIKELNNTTLTQMFPNLSSRASNENTNDSDFTYCPNADEMTTAVNVNSKGTLEKEKPRRELIYKEPVVRGKARLELEGWDCSDCKAFYDKLDLNTQDTKKMLNKCSRHRSKFRAEDFTPKEFWKLDFPPTPESMKRKPTN